MKIHEITIDDIKAKTIWRVLDSHAENWLNWQIDKTKRVVNGDIIVHSAISVDEYTVYPSIVTKYYEDAGEVGEIGIYDRMKWINSDEVVFKGNVNNRPFLAYISNLDIHEYQKGVFDNRKWHYGRFNHYITQLGHDRIVKYVEKEIEIPPSIFNGTMKEKRSFLIKLAINFNELSKTHKIAAANKTMDKFIKIVSFLKQDYRNHEMLKNLLACDNAIIVDMLQYQLVDLFEETCLCLIGRKAQEDSINGIGAKFWLSDYKSKKSMKVD